MNGCRVTGIANAVEDPDFRSIGNGNTKVCNMRLAFNRNYKVNDEWKKDTTFLKSVSWNGIAQMVRDNVKKGDRLFVEGYLMQESYVDKDDNKKTYFTLRLDHVLSVQRFKKKEEEARVSESVNVVETQQPGGVTTTQEAVGVTTIQQDDSDVPF